MIPNAELPLNIPDGPVIKPADVILPEPVVEMFPPVVIAPDVDDMPPVAVKRPADVMVPVPVVEYEVPQEEPVELGMPAPGYVNTNGAANCTNTSAVVPTVIGRGVC